MQKAKIIALKKEFPFLEKIISLTKWQRGGEIKVRRLDAAWLNTIPVREWWSGMAGSHEEITRLFAVSNDTVSEIKLSPEETHEVVGVTRSHSEGQTFLSSIIEDGNVNGEYYILHSRVINSVYDDRDEDNILILKTLKGSTISLEWAKALRDAEFLLKKELDSLLPMEAKLTEYFANLR